MWRAEVRRWWGWRSKVIGRNVASKIHEQKIRKSKTMKGFEGPVAIGEKEQNSTTGNIQELKR